MTTESLTIGLDPPGPTFFVNAVKDECTNGRLGPGATCTFEVGFVTMDNVESIARMTVADASNGSNTVQLIGTGIGL